MIKINLIVKEKAKKGLPKEAFMLIAIALISIFVLFVVHSIFSSKLRRIENTIKEVEREIQQHQKTISQMKSLEKTKAELENKRNIIANLDKMRQEWPVLMDRLCDVVPPHLWLDKINTKKGVIKIIGNTITYLNVAEFMNSLQGIKNLSDVELLSANSGVIDGKNVVKFEFKCSLKAQQQEAVKKTKTRRGR